MLLTPKSDDQQRNEVYVLRTAKDLATLHICDAIQATINSLTSIKWELSAGHDGKHLSDDAKAGGVLIANRAMQHLLDDAPIKYRDMVNAANEDSEVVDEDTVQTDLMGFVSDLMQEWSE